ncbi:hypothetical protein F7734_48860 [Scytonema sp. UIC 10036]|nr:hypothetical protein [Scytonema sp. UIC 10036]
MGIGGRLSVLDNLKTSLMYTVMIEVTQTIRGKTCFWLIKVNTSHEQLKLKCTHEQLLKLIEKHPALKSVLGITDKMLEGTR